MKVIQNAMGRDVNTAEVNLLATLFSARRYAELEASAYLLIERYPYSGFTWKALSVSQLIQGKDALAALQKAAELLPDDPEAHGNLGNALGSIGQLDKAVACYLRALQINSEYAKANNNLGNALEDLGQLENAVASYRRALEIEPDLVEAHYNLGNAFRDLGQLENAVASYRRTLEIEPDLVEAHCNLGNALRDLGQLENAVASYHQALEIKPGYAMAHNNLGLVLLSQGKLDNALEKFRRAVEIKPDFADAQCNLGSTLQSLGRFDVVANMYGGMEINLDTEYCDENGQPGRPSIRKYNNRKGAGPGKCARMGLPRYWINTATRSLVLSDTDFAYQGLGPPINLTRTYNSNAPVRIPANVTSDSGNVTANSGERDRGVGVARFDSMPSCFFG